MKAGGKRENNDEEKRRGRRRMSRSRGVRTITLKLHSKESRSVS